MKAPQLHLKEYENHRLSVPSNPEYVVPQLKRMINEVKVYYQAPEIIL